MTITVASENVLAVRTTLSFDRALASLRSELRLREFRVINELLLDREMYVRTGVTPTRYTVLVIWDPFSAYQAVLSDANGGLVVPFNVAVYEQDGLTTISTLNQPLLASNNSLGVQVLGQELNRRMRDVLLHLANHESASADSKRTDLTVTHARGW